MYKGKESNLQKAIAKYLDAKNLLWCHVPNEGMHKPQYRKTQAAMGLKKGVPDILIFTPSNGFNGFAIELKANYNKVTPEQIEWMENLAKCGWKVALHNDLDDCIKDIDNYLKIP